jgi:ubiquitin carboxyl-terminal hydrolase 5/13
MSFATKSAPNCKISFDWFVCNLIVQRSEGGLYVDLNSFLAFGQEFVMWNYEKTGDPVYLNIQQRPKLVSENRPHKKPTLLAIGISTSCIYTKTFSLLYLLPKFSKKNFSLTEFQQAVPVPYCW